MIFAKLDVDIASNPKLVQVGDPAAELLHVRGICYARKYLTDGWLPVATLADLSPRIPSAQRRVRALCEAQLWHPVIDGQMNTDCETCKATYTDLPEADGWVIHDYLEYQESREDVAQRMDKAATRARKAARARWGKRDAPGDAPSIAHAHATRMPEPESEPDTPPSPAERGSRSVDRVTPREAGTSPRAKGTNPRAVAAGAKRARAVAACRRLWQQGVADGENREALRESLEREYRHDPAIVTEAIAVSA